jgi:cytochrome b6-f complex iron-sulfur subunit
MNQDPRPTDAETARKDDEPSRRDFLNEIAAGALGVAGLGAAVVTVQYLSPNVLFEPPLSFRVGSPESYPVDSVTYLEDQQVYIVRTPQGFYAVSAVCTHLGCMTQWNPAAKLIQCPCHGSVFKSDGTVEQGPAPRALQHFAMRLLTDGNLLVDKLEVLNQAQVLEVQVRGAMKDGMEGRRG